MQPIHVAQAYNQLDAKGKRAVQRALAGKTSTWNKYYSTIRFAFNVAAGFTYTVPAGTQFRAFGYAIGQDLSAAGFPAGTPATSAETNLIKPSETIAGEKVVIFGASLMLDEDSDAELAKILWPKLSVIVALNGDQQQYKLGTAGMIPCSGGLTGMGDSYVQVPPLSDTYQSRCGNITNGAPFVANFYPFPEALIWSPSGAGDSSLVVKLTAERQAQFTTQLAADRAGAAGVAAWTHPSAAGALGTFVDVRVTFWSRQLSPRSENQ